MKQALSKYCQPNILKVCLYGFISGMSLLLSGNTLNFWLSSSEVDIKIVGFFSCVALPYSLKYIIAILIEKFSTYLFDNKINFHKTWLIISQIMMVIMLVSLSFLDPYHNLLLIAVIAFLIALFAVIQDIVLNGNRISLLKEEEQSYGTAMYTVGYRLGMVFSGAGIIFSSIYIEWTQIYLIMAGVYTCIMLVMVFYFIETPNSGDLWIKDEKSLMHGVFIRPLEYFGGYRNIIWILMFIILYLLSDNMLMVMLNSFLIQHGYSIAEIASVSKVFGTVMVIIGGLVGGAVISKFGIRNSLLTFCFLNMIGHPFFIILDHIDKSIPFLYFVTGYAALTGGMLTVAYVMFISKLSEGKYAATLYALLSSAMGLSRVLFPSISGIVVANLGWEIFFVIITFISFFSLILTWLIPVRIYDFYQNSSSA